MTRHSLLHVAIRNTGVVVNNGFLGIASPHPFKKDLLLTTTGMFDSRFVGYIQDHLSGATRGKILQYFHHHGPLSLMFEVIDSARDPHIIEYGEEMQGVHLIGARGLGWDDQPWTEEALDKLAAELGLRRPTWSVMTFGEVKERLAGLREEGFMVRALDAKQTYICKFKSPYYLATKFLGRLSDNKTKAMFGNPKSFKKTVDEEFYFLVDALTARFSVTDYLALEPEARIPVVRQLIAEFTGV